MIVSQWVALALMAVVAGICLVVQASISADLRMNIGSAAWAAFISYFGGTLAMIVVLVVTRDPWPATALLTKTPWWAFIPGVFGAIYIVIAILLLPKLGAAAVIALVVMGQMVGSMIFDHFGLFGLAKHSVDFPRLFGAILLVVGVALIRR